MYLVGHNSPQIYVAIYTFEGTMISSNLFGPASVGKGIYLKVITRISGRDAVSLVPRRRSDVIFMQLHPLRSALVQ